MEAQDRPLLTALRLSQLEAILGSRTRALRTLRWLYATPRPSALPERLEGVAQPAWRTLADRCRWPELSVADQTLDPDGTRKLALRLGDATVETVLIPGPRRSTVCVSSQVGCTRACAFCATAGLGFVRNLTAGEIVAQYWLAAGLAAPHQPPRNVVFMGMGEPMDNLDAVLEAIGLLTQSPAPQLAAHQITVSTSGVLPGMRRFLAESRASLALSVNGSSSAQRERWMPQTRTWPLEALLELLREDGRRDLKRVHLMEYVLFAGQNDTDEDADRLARLLAGVRARVNLIPHNPVPGLPFAPPDEARILAFQRRLLAQGLPCFVRWSKGQQASAACGQLAFAGSAALQQEVRRAARPRRIRTAADG